MIRLIVAIFIFSLLFPIEIPSHENKDKWSTLSNADGIWVGTLKVDNIDWARSEAVLPYPIEDVQRII